MSKRSNPPKDFDENVDKSAAALREIFITGYTKWNHNWLSQYREMELQIRVLREEKNVLTEEVDKLKRKNAQNHVCSPLCAQGLQVSEQPEIQRKVPEQGNSNGMKPPTNTESEKRIEEPEATIAALEARIVVLEKYKEKFTELWKKMLVTLGDCKSMLQIVVEETESEGRSGPELPPMSEMATSED